MISLQNLMQAFASTPPFPLDFTSQWPPGASGSALGVQVPPAQLWWRLAHQASYLWMELGQELQGGGFTSKSQLLPSWANGTDAEVRRPAGAQKWSALGLSWLPRTHQCASQDGVFPAHHRPSFGLVGLFQDPVLTGAASVRCLLVAQSRTITSEKPCILGQLTNRYEILFLSHTMK